MVARPDAIHGLKPGLPDRPLCGQNLEIWPLFRLFGHQKINLATFEKLATFWPFFILFGHNKNYFGHFPKCGHFWPFSRFLDKNMI